MNTITTFIVLASLGQLPASVTMHDGSTIYGTISDKGSLQVATKYGMLDFPLSEINRVSGDVLESKELVVRGRNTAATLEIKTESLGDLKLSWKGIKELLLVRPETRTLKMGWGTESGWYDSGIEVLPWIQVEITAKGEIDLYPTNPGAYMSSPDGNPSAGGTSYHSGALIGKVGSKEFLIGSNYTGTPGRGRLMLKVNRSPHESWRCIFQGAYHVEIHSKTAKPR